MFNNVGKKLKTLAVIAFIGGVIISTLFAFLAAYLLITFDDKPMLILLGIIVFIVIEAIGILISWLTVLMLYAFGELVDTNQIQVKQNYAIIKLLSGQDYSLETEEAAQTEPILDIKKYRNEKYMRNYANNAFGAIDIPTDGEQGGAKQ